MKKLYFIFIALLFIGLASCGSDEKSDEEKAQEMAEGILKSVTGKEVDIQTEKNEDGETVNMTIKTDEGEVSISGNQTELPDDFPDIYIVDGERSDIGIVSSDKGKMITFKITTDDDINTVKEKIKSEMSDWKNNMDMSTPDGSMLTFEKDKETTVNITIGKDGEKTEVAYMVSYTTK